MRHRGRVRIAVLTPRTQICLVAAAALLLSWLVYASAAVLFQKRSVWLAQDNAVRTQSAYQGRLGEMQEAYEELNLRLAEAQRRFDRITRELEERHRNLAALIGMRDPLGIALEERRKKMEKFDKTDRKAKPDKASRIFPMRMDDSVLLLSRPDSRGSVVGEVMAAALAPESFRYVLSQTGDSAFDRIAERVGALDRSQQAILDHLDEETVLQSRAYERLIRATESLDADLLAQRLAESAPAAPAEEAVGGPFVPLPETAATAAGVKDKASGPAAVLRVRNGIARLLDLERSLLHLPLAAPMGSYYITSGFGPRVDPFTQKWAWHEGVDLAADADSMIWAPLPGKVVFSGRARGYGLLVEIDHGHGIMTRYGHLKKVYVKAGDRLDFAGQIGVVGSSGRSTGDHLHYEILLDGKAYDPWKFLEAGRHVFEIKG